MLVESLPYLPKDNLKILFPQRHCYVCFTSGHQWAFTLHEVSKHCALIITTAHNNHLTKATIKGSQSIKCLEYENKQN